MPCQTHEWAFGASIRSFFLNSLGEKQDPSPFFIYFLFASCLQLAPVTRVKPCQTHEWAFGASLRHSAFLLFLYFFVFFVFFTIFMFPSHLQHPQGSACPVKTPTYPHQLTTVTRVKPCQTHKWALVPASGSRQEGAPPIYCISCKANTHRFGRAARCRP